MDEVVTRDLRRKVQRIIMNYASVQGRIPSIKELKACTGISKNELYSILTYLAENEYIEWNIKKPEEIRLIHTRMKELREGRMQEAYKEKQKRYNYNIWDL